MDKSKQIKIYRRLKKLWKTKTVIRQLVSALRYEDTRKIVPEETEYVAVVQVSRPLQWL